jgi:hypothetical protein
VYKIVQRAAELSHESRIIQMLFLLVCRNSVSNKLRSACCLAGDIGKVCHTIPPLWDGLKTWSLLHPREKDKVRGKMIPIFNLLRIYKNGVQRFTSGAAFQTVNGCVAQVEGQVLMSEG